jgi:hypothetical protein
LLRLVCKAQVQTRQHQAIEQGRYFKPATNPRNASPPSGLKNQNIQKQTHVTF